MEREREKSPRTIQEYFPLDEQQRISTIEFSVKGIQIATLFRITSEGGEREKKIELTELVRITLDGARYGRVWNSLCLGDFTRLYNLSN